jgi:hypothetical protein
MKINIGKPEKPFVQIRSQNGDTKTIIKNVVEIYEESKGQLKEFSSQFERSKEGLEKLWHFVKDNIHYVEDKDNSLFNDLDDDIQVIQTPEMLWENRKVGGDCKSQSVFVASFLYNIGIDFCIRFVSYDPSDKRATHVYCHANLDGHEFNMDTVYYGFDEEKPYSSKKDFKKVAKIYKMGAIQPINILKDISNGIISQGVGDVSKMSKREFLAYLYRERNELTGVSNSETQQNENVVYSLTRSNNAALDAPAFPKYEAISGNWFSEQWQKLVNWIVKGAEGFAPYFLYQFLPTELEKNLEVVKRMRAQNKILDWILKVTKIDPVILKEILYNGILKVCKATPTEIINSATIYEGKIGFIDPVTLSALLPLIIEGVKALIKLVQEVSTLFSVNKETVRTEMTQENASDINQLTRKMAVKPQKNYSLAIGGLVILGFGFLFLKK